jgi:hypothetical protein
MLGFFLEAVIRLNKINNLHSRFKSPPTIFCAAIGKP